MSYLQLARSRRITIQFGEIMLYIHTVSIGSRYICPFSHPILVLFHPFPVFFHPFPVLFHITFHLKSLSCPQPQAGKAANTFSWGKMLFARRYIICIFVGRRGGSPLHCKMRGKAALIGIQDRGTNVVSAVVVEAS